MSYYIGQPCTPSFHIGLVKSESDFVRSVETGLGRWMLVVAVISVNAYLFFLLSQTWPVTLVALLPDSKKTKVEVATKRLLH